MQISYAQRLEDYHLDLVFKGQTTGFYVDVGGGHPVADNVSYHFYLKGWNGVVVEPQERLAKIYTNIRPRDFVVSDLVGSQAGVIDFHQVDRLHGFSTTIESNAKNASNFGVKYISTKKRVVTLSSILEKLDSKQIDFLKIDVEGAEYSVISGLDLSRFRPRVVCVEAVAPGDMKETWHEWQPAILTAGYQFVFEDGLNRFYVANEHAHLGELFPKSMSDWGIVKHFYEFGCADKRAEHPDYPLAQRLIKGFLAGLTELTQTEILALIEKSAGSGGIESDQELMRLLHGNAHLSANTDIKSSETIVLDDHALAAIGRIAAQYDGGMINEE